MEEHCHAFLFDLNISKMPMKAKQMVQDYFYLESMPRNPPAPWYFSSGRTQARENGKRNVLKFEPVGNVAILSLRVTGASALF